jgi:hypothetical protein
VRTHVVLSDEVVAAIDERVGERVASAAAAGFSSKPPALERLELEAVVCDSSGLLKDEHYPHGRDTKAVQEWVRRSRRGALTADDVTAR